METTLVNKIRKALEKEYNGSYYKIHGGPYQSTGMSDIIGIQKSRQQKGEFVAIEVKLPSNKKGPWKNGVTARQDLFLLEIEAQGGKCGIARTIEEALKIASGTLIYAGSGVNRLKFNKKR